MIIVFQSSSVQTLIQHIHISRFVIVCVENNQQRDFKSRFLAEIVVIYCKIYNVFGTYYIYSNTLNVDTYKYVTLRNVFLPPNVSDCPKRIHMTSLNWLTCIIAKERQSVSFVKIIKRVIPNLCFTYWIYHSCQYYKYVYYSVIAFSLTYTYLTILLKK